MIAIKNLSYKINKVSLLNDINLDFEKGKTYGIIGPNGAGKSTLLKCIMRINEPSGNSIFLDDVDITSFNIKDFSKKISFVFQENNREVDFTVYEIIMMGRYTYMDFLESESKEDIKIVDEIIEKLGLIDLKDRYISELSGGEAQKVFIARALAQKTEIILLDEPTSMLDIHNSIEIMNLVENLKKEYGLTIIMVLHDLNIAFTYCDNISLIDGGSIIMSDEKNKVIESERVEEVYQRKIKIIKDDDGFYVVPKRR